MVSADAVLTYDSSFLFLQNTAKEIQCDEEDKKITVDDTHYGNGDNGNLRAYRLRRWK